MFLALDLPLKITALIEKIIWRIKNSSNFSAGAGDVRWVESEAVHLTLKFLGNVKKCDLAKLETALRPLCAQHSPFNLALDQVGFFPSARRPRVVWIGLKGDLGRLSELHGMVDDCCGSLGFEKERRSFLPHITIGRVKHIKGRKYSENFIEGLSDFANIINTTDFGPFEIEELSLYSSELKKTGAVHTKLRTFPFDGNAG